MAIATYIVAHLGFSKGILSSIFDRYCHIDWHEASNLYCNQATQPACKIAIASYTPGKLVKFQLVDKVVCT